MVREIRERKSLVVPVLLGKIDVVSIPSDLQGKRFIDLRYNFLKRYQLQRNTLMDFVRLAARSTASPLKEEWFLGNQAIAMLLTRDYSGHPVTKLHPQMVESIFKFTFGAKAKEWPEPLRLGRKFLAEYGIETARKLVLFVLDHSGIDWFGGFTEEELDNAFHEIEFLSWAFMTREIPIEDLGHELKFGINEEGTLSYRFVEIALKS